VFETFFDYHLYRAECDGGGFSIFIHSPLFHHLTEIRQINTSQDQSHIILDPKLQASSHRCSFQITFQVPGLTSQCTKEIIGFTQRIDSLRSASVKIVAILLEPLDDLLTSIFFDHPVREGVCHGLVLGIFANEDVCWVQKRVFFIVFAFGLKILVSLRLVSFFKRLQG